MPVVTWLKTARSTSVDVVGGVAKGVVTDEGHCEADAVVLAGGWQSSAIDVEGLPPLPLTPVKGQMAALQSMGESINSHLVIRAFDVYIVPRSGGRVVLGATSEPGVQDTRSTPDSVRDLVDAARATVPDLAGSPLVEHWAGVRPKTPDGLPILGPCDVQNLVLAAGHHRNGILWMPVTAQMIGDHLLGQDSEKFQHQFALSRFY